MRVPLRQLMERGSWFYGDQFNLIEYKWIVDGVEEDLVDDALNGLGGTCIDTTDYNAYANRMWLPNEGDQSDTFGTCAACDAEPFVMTVDLSCYDANDDGNPMKLLP